MTQQRRDLIKALQDKANHHNMSHLAYKTKLKLNNQQKTLMRQCAGYSRWVWNWALDFKQKAYAENIKLDKSQIRKYYTNHVKPEYPWQLVVILCPF